VQKPTHVGEQLADTSRARGCCTGEGRVLACSDGDSVGGLGAWAVVATAFLPLVEADAERTQDTGP
jgi:hypothetical protein